jgi:hypothetical protein
MRFNEPATNRGVGLAPASPFVGTRLNIIAI